MFYSGYEMLWLFFIYSFLGWIERIPVKAGKILSWVMIVFFCCNIAVSCMALARSNQRVHGVPAEYIWQKIMDEKYNNARLNEIYPNAIQVN